MKLFKKVEPPDETEQEKQSKWQQKISDAKDKKDEWKELFQVDKGIAYFEGRQRENDIGGSEWVSINKVYAHLQAQLPVLYGIDPYFYVKVKRMYDPTGIEVAELRARVRQAYLNYVKESTKLKDHARLGIQDAQFSFGILKIKFNADLVDNPDAKRPITGDDGEEILGEDGQTIINPDQIPINERYSVTRVDPDKFFFDPNAGPLPDTWSWIAEEITMTREEVREKYGEDVLDMIGTKGAKKSDAKDKKKVSFFSQWQEDEDDIFTFYEVYDLKENVWFVMADGAEELIEEEKPLPPGVVGHPYAILRFVLRSKSAYPLPPVSQAIDPQCEYNKVRNRTLTHHKRYTRKYEVFAAGLEDPIESELEKLIIGQDGACIRTKTPGQVVKPIPDAPMNPQNYADIALLNNDIIEIFGVPDEARGINSADSATAAALLNKRLNIREGDKLSIVRDWIIEVAKKIDNLVAANISQDEAVKIAGPEGEAWEMVRVIDYDSIQGDFEYSIDIGATTPRIPDIERAQFMSVIQTFAQFPQMLLSQRLTEKVFKLFEIQDQIMIQELMQIGRAMMQGQLPPPSGSNAPGIPTNSQATKEGGKSGGFKGGNNNGGGSPLLHSI
jgi:hypothetical protein